MNINFALLLAGIIAFSFGLALLIREIKSSKKNTDSVTAKVIDYYSEVSQDAEQVTKSLIYYPVLKYKVNGQWHEKKGETGNGKKKYEIGEEIEILCDPDDPEKFTICGDNTDYLISSVFMFIGAVLAVIGIIGK